MKKIYSKILSFILLFFSLLKKALTKEINPLKFSSGQLFPIALAGAPMPYDPKTPFYGIRILLFIPLILFSIITSFIFIYFKLKKKNLSKLKFFIVLTILSLLTFALFEFVLSMDANLNDKHPVIIILAILSLVAVILLLCYLTKLFIIFIKFLIKKTAKK